MEYIAKAETGTISERTRNALAARSAQPMPDTVTVFRNLFFIFFFGQRNQFRISRNPY